VRRGSAVNIATPIRELAPNLPEGLPRGLPNYWYPVLQSEELPQDKPVGLRVLGETVAVWRNAKGEPCAVKDRCPHRSMKLSVGRILDGDLQCILHGLRFDGTGRCSLIPWETERSKLHDMVAVHAYPARELGGYIWTYLGDAQKFPPPPLESEVPEELLKPDEFVCFRLPTQTWKSNWLLAIDGSDGFHAITLHTISQSKSDAARQGGVRLEDRRVKIIKTNHGIRGVSVDLDGKPIGHGHYTTDVRGDRFALPCVTTNPISPAPNAASYASRLWQFPVDETTTMVVRFLTFRARTEAERAKAKATFQSVAAERLDKVAEEDAWAAEAQGDLLEARRGEFLLAPDEDVVKVRRMIARAFVSQAGGVRDAVTPGALDCPV
jgi:phenylpropionate dioxygenase-like ring-hydroxylating dioxygenase large terminal subunit